VNIATEAVLYALHNVRTVYSTVVGRLLIALARREQQLADLRSSGGDDESATDEWTVAARSLLLQALRAFHGAEASYSAPPVDGFGADGTAQSKVVLTAAGDVESALAQAQREGVFESSARVSAVAVWRKFVSGNNPL
jgi:hypothetical protein